MQENKIKSKFDVGDKVKSKITNDKGIITNRIYSINSLCKEFISYDVQFSSIKLVVQEHDLKLIMKPPFKIGDKVKSKLSDDEFSKFGDTGIIKEVSRYYQTYKGYNYKDYNYIVRFKSDFFHTYNIWGDDLELISSTSQLRKIQTTELTKRVLNLHLDVFPYYHKNIKDIILNTRIENENVFVWCTHSSLTGKGKTITKALVNLIKKYKEQKLKMDSKI